MDDVRIFITVPYIDSTKRVTWLFGVFFLHTLWRISEIYTEIERNLSRFLRKVVKKIFYGSGYSIHLKVVAFSGASMKNKENNNKEK